MIEQEITEKYLESGRNGRDESFRRSLALGPTERRWLAWAGARVLILCAYKTSSQGLLCPTPWVYRFTPLGRSTVELSSSEINFCDDVDVLDLLPPWNRDERVVSQLRDELENPVLMYHI